jgi:D-amino-acid dehydrogenase
MKIAVIGAGVTGVTSAHELCADGHDVTVFESNQTAAEGASFANGGLVLPGWPASLGPMESLGNLLLPGATNPGARRLNRWPGGGTWPWIWRWHRARHTDPAARPAAQFQLIRYSQERLDAITEDHQLAHERQQGLLLLWRHEREALQTRKVLPLLREWGLVAREVDPDTARQIEPALNNETPLHGALELPGATHANTRQFTLLLKNVVQQAGGRFEFGHTVERIDAGNAQEVSVVLTDGQRVPFDQIVVCAGAASARLLRPLGQALPLQPLYAHSVSAAVREPLDAPVSAVLDARQQVTVARLGQRVRVAGGALLGGLRARPSADELKRLYRVLMDWFPGAARLGGPKGSVQEWFGAQLVLPDGMPLIGQSAMPRVWLNLGHGACGWSMACGSARALADLIGGRATDIDMSGFAPTRLAR